MADTDVVTSINVGEGQNSIARLPCLASASGTLGVDFASGTDAWIYGERRACFGYAVVGCVAGLAALDRIELSFVITVHDCRSWQGVRAGSDLRHGARVRPCSGVAGVHNRHPRSPASSQLAAAHPARQSDTLASATARLSSMSLGGVPMKPPSITKNVTPRQRQS